MVEGRLGIDQSLISNKAFVRICQQKPSTKLDTKYIALLSGLTHN